MKAKKSSLVTSDEKIFSMTYNKMAAFLIAFTIATNTVSLTLQRLSNAEQKSIYDEKANKRRLNHGLKNEKFERTIEFLKLEIKNLKE
jgi:hypothetical protein